MSEYLHWRYLVALGALAVLGASAQPTLPTSHQSPAPAASATTTQASTTPYRSAFERYQPFAEEKVLPWKEANDTVRAIGGWRAYAKEANEEAGTPASTPASAPYPAAGRAKP
jgi:hypothetical protein